MNILQIVKEKKWAVLAGGLVLLAVLIPGTLLLRQLRAPSDAAPAAGGSWGLSFRKANAPPVADESAETLLAYDARYIGDTAGNTVYLTFDCGYENGNTAAILDVLRDHGAPAAFFVVGHYLETEPELVKRMAAEGHTVGNHTWSHPDMSKITDPAEFSRQLSQVVDKYQEITGEKMSPYYRPPQGLYSPESLKTAQSLGFRTVFWSLAYVDWKGDAQPEEQEAIDTLCRRIHGGAVVLLHNTSATNAKILDRVLTRWEEMGYTFGTLDQLFQS